MTRSELVLELAKRAELSPRDSDRIIRILTQTIEEFLASGEKVTISGFGTFERRRRKATVARNPKTHEPMKIAEQYVAAFRAGSSLKEAVKKEVIGTTEAETGTTGSTEISGSAGGRLNSD